MVRQAFNRAGAKREGSSGNDFLEAILLERPDLKDQTAYFPGKWEADANGHKQGNCGHTIFIGDEVFKGPSDAGETHGFDDEYKILQQMEGKNLPVPKVTCVGKETFFYGMTRMPGITLNAFEQTEPLTTEQARRLAKDLAAFVVGMAEAFPSHENGGFKTHTDLHDENILIDPQTRKLTAVIDFGRVGYRSEPQLYLYGQLKQMFDEEYKSRKKPMPEASPAANSNGISP